MKYDLIILGGGPAGLTAGIYARRARISTLLIEKIGIGGKLPLIDIIENYPGFIEIGGMDLSQKFEEHVKNVGLEVKYAEVTSIKADADIKTVKTNDGEYESRAIIIATGVKSLELDVKGAKEFIGRGISYCATCDGPLFANRTVAVIGGGDSAIKEAIFLTKNAAKVYVVHRRDALRAEKILQEKALNNPKIKVLWNSVVREIHGDRTVSGITLENVKTKEHRHINLDGVFVYIGNVPNTGFIDVKKDPSGYIITDNGMRTSADGIFAAGDCRSKMLYQVSTAVGDGATAAFTAEQYLEGVL